MSGQIERIAVPLDAASETQTAIDTAMRIEVAPIEPTALHEKLGELGCRVLALEADGGRLRAIVERFACDLLIVR
jgi:hypothetical protein